MKKCIVAILLPLFLLILGVKLAQAQKWNEKEVTVNQPSASVSLSLAYRIYATVGGQMFTCKVKNLTKSKINITFDLVAYTLCGNTVSKHIDVDLDPAEGAGNSGILDNTYDGQVKSSDCAGTKFRYHSQDVNMDLDGTNRIRTLGYKNFVVKIYPATSVASKGKTATSAATNAGLGSDKTVGGNAPASFNNVKSPTTAASQQTAYAPDVPNSNNPIQNSLNLNIAKINAQAAGNTAQVLQIQQQQTADLQRSIAGVTSTLNDMLTRNASLQADATASINEGEDKLKRELLYKCILNYSFWYLDHEIFMMTARSAISYRTGEPDYYMTPNNNYTNTEGIKTHIADGDFEAFYQSLNDRGNINNVDNFEQIYPYQDDFASIRKDFEHDEYHDNPKKQDKEIESYKKKLGKGDMLAAFDLLCYYVYPVYQETATARDERLRNAALYWPVILNWCQNTYPKGRLTPVLQCLYHLQANAETDPAKALIYRQKIDSLFDPKAYTIFPSKMLSSNFTKYYSDEFYYYLYFLNGWEKIKLYHQLYKNEGGTPAKNKKYFDLALQEYLNIGNNLKIIFQDKKLQRPFTHDDHWADHH